MSLISIGRLRVHIIDRADPHSDDYWDGNWLIVRAYISDDKDDLNAVASGPIIRLPELEEFLREITRMYRARCGTAILNCMEPNLYVELKMSKPSALHAMAKISSDVIDEDTEEFNFILDPNDLNPIIADLNGVLTEFPIKGSL